VVKSVKSVLYFLTFTHQHSQLACSSPAKNMTSISLFRVSNLQHLKNGCSLGVANKFIFQ